MAKGGLLTPSAASGHVLSLIARLLARLGIAATDRTQGRGAARAIQILGFLLRLYLLFGLLRLFIPALFTPAHSAFYPVIAILGAGAFVLFAASVPLALQTQRHKGSPASTRHATTFTYMVAFTTLFLAFLIWSDARRDAAMTARYCENAGTGPCA